jgi:trimeric autotransporter adhesin
MKRFVTAFLILPALLVACPQAPTPEVKPPVVAEPFKPTLLGSLTVEFGVDGKGTSAQFKPSTIQSQTLTLVTESTLTFTNQIFQTIDVPATTDRYLMARFTVTNTSASPRTNLTLVAYRKNNNSGGSAFKEIQTFAGGTVNVNNLVPVNAMKTTGCTLPATVCVDNNNADLQIYTRSEIATLTAASQGTLINVNPITGEGILQYAYVARSSATSRTIAANNGTGTIALALQVPQAGDAGAGNNAYRYSMTFLVFTDNVARVTESTSEQGTNSGAATRATSFGGSPQIATMCGTTLTGSTFIPGVRTVGVGTDTQWMGGNFFDNTETAANFTGIIGNTEKAYTGSNASLTARFSSLGGATLTVQNQDIASATTTNGGNLGISNTLTGTVTVRPKVNSRVADGFGYQISDGTCTSPNIAATIAAPTNTVWYIDSAASSGGDGRSTAPFQSVSSLNVVASPNTVTANDDFIYIKGSTGNSTLVLKTNQQVIGSGVALEIGSETLATAGTAPTISSPLTVATGNTIQGLTFGGLNGTVGGTLTVSSASIVAGAAQAINLTGGTMAVTLTKVDSSGGTNNIALTNTAGTFAINGTGTDAGSGGTLSGATSDGIVLIGVSSTTIKNLNLSGSKQHGINWSALSGSSALTLTKVAVSSIGSSTPSIIGHGLFGVISGNATGTLTIDGGSSFATAQQSGIDVSTATGSTAKLNADIQNTTFTNNGATQVVVNFDGDRTGNTARVSNNTLTGTVSGISVANSSSRSVQTRVNSNSIDTQNGFGIGVQFYLSGIGGLIAESNSNTITNGGQAGINATSDVAAGAVPGTRLDITANSNSVTQSSINANFGIIIRHAATNQNVTICANAKSNTLQNTGGSATAGIRMQQRAGNTLFIQGVNDGAAASAAATYLNGSNTTVTPASSVIFPAATTAVAGTCITPTF